MSRCPTCDGPLAEAECSGLAVEACPECAGMLVDATRIEFLRARHGAGWTPEEVRALEAEVRDMPALSLTRCPRCRRSMTQVPVPLDGQAFYLDYCEACGAYWFGCGELELVQVLHEKEEAAARRALTPGRPPRVDPWPRGLTRGILPRQPAWT